MKYLYLSLVSVILISCQPKAEPKKVETIEPELLITCDGIGEVKLTDSYADLEKKFGASALSAHENTVAGKFTTVWQESPKQINVYWKEEQKPFKTIRYIEAVDASAPYMTKDSLRIGMTLKELVKKNGSMPVTFSNFTANEFPGLIKGFNNGEISTANPCFGGRLESLGQRPIYVDELRAFEAQQEVKSFEKILQRMEVVLGAIRISAKK
jgi:hypothetical protein